MFDVAYMFFLEALKALGWIIPVYLIFGLISDAIIKGMDK